MVDGRAVVVRRRSARAILIDDDGYLVLIRRTKPGRAPWWTTAGGGVEDGDASIEAAMHRELAEELGVKAIGSSQVFLDSWSTEEGPYVHHFFVTRLASMDLSTRNGPEFDDPSRGAYDPERFDLRGEELTGIDLRPAALKVFILGNREALLVEAGFTA